MTDPTDDEPICPLSADGLCCPERDGRCHWCDRDCTQAPSTALDAAKFAADVWEIADSTGVAQREDEDTIAWLRRAVRELRAVASEASEQRRAWASLQHIAAKLWPDVSGTAADGTRYLLAGGRAYTQAHGDAPEAIDPLAYRGVVRLARDERVAGFDEAYKALTFHEAWGRATTRPEYDKSAWVAACKRFDGREAGMWRTFDTWRELVYGRPEASPATGRARYPLLVHPEDVGSRAPLDPIEAMACRRNKASEIGVDWGALARASAEAIPAALRCGDFPPKSWSVRSGRFVWLPVDAEAVRDRVGLSSVAELKAWADRWIMVDAWVCEGDEPAPSTAITSPPTQEPPRHAYIDFESVEAEPGASWGLDPGWYWYEPEYPDEGGCGPYDSREQAIAEGGRMHGDTIAVFEIKPEGDEP